MKSGNYSEVLSMVCSLLDEPDKKACVAVEGIDQSEFLSSVILRCVCGASEAWRWRRDLVPRSEKSRLETVIRDSMPTYSAMVRVVEEPFEVKDGEELFVVERWMQQAIDLFADLYDRHAGNVQEAINGFDKMYERMSFEKCREDLGPYRRTEAIERIVATPGLLAFLRPEAVDMISHRGFLGFLLEYLNADERCLVEFLGNLIAVEGEDIRSFKTWFTAWLIYRKPLALIVADNRFKLFPYGEEGRKLRYAKREDELFEVPAHDYQNELFFMVRSLTQESDVNLFVKNVKALKRLLPKDDLLVADNNDHDALWYLFAADIGVDERSVYSEILCTYLGLDRNRETKWGVTWESVNEIVAWHESQGYSI